MADDSEKELLYGIIPHMSPELQEKITNQMDVDERSKYDEYMTDAGSSEVPVYSLSFRYFSTTFVRVEMFHTMTDENMTSFSYDFIEVSKTNKYLARLNVKRQEVWRIELDPSMNIIEQSKVFFTNMLCAYQTKIEMLSCTGSPNIIFDDLKHQVKNLKALTDIEADQTIYLEDLIPVVFNDKRPLQDVRIEGEKINNVLKNFDQIYQVQDYLILKHLKLNFQQFQKLRARTVRIHIGSLNEHMIYSIFARWQMGIWPMVVKSYEWHLDESNFDLEKLSLLFGNDSKYALEREKKVVFRRDRDQAWATIWWNTSANSLQFHVADENEEY